MTLRRLTLWVPVLLASAVFASVLFLADCNFPRFYEDKMRASLFTGFFTLSGFLLSAMTFIILNLKKEVYSTKTYLKRVSEQSSLADGQQIEVYRPLRDVGKVLLLNVALCLASSIAQFSLGLIGSRFFVAVCLALAAAAAGMLVLSLVIISLNLHDMYDHFEHEARAEMEKLGPRSSDVSGQ